MSCSGPGACSRPGCRDALHGSDSRICIGLGPGRCERSVAGHPCAEPQHCNRGSTPLTVKGTRRPEHGPTPGASRNCPTPSCRGLALGTVSSYTVSLEKSRSLYSLMENVTRPSLLRRPQQLRSDQICQFEILDFCREMCTILEHVGFRHELYTIFEN